MKIQNNLRIMQGSSFIKTWNFCVFELYYSTYYSVPFLFCFMMKLDINNDLNTFFWFLDEAKLLILKNNLRTVLGSNPEKCRTT